MGSHHLMAMAGVAQLDHSTSVFVQRGTVSSGLDVDPERHPVPILHDKHTVHYI